jgi:hypothetical protein
VESFFTKEALWAIKKLGGPTEQERAPEEDD